MHDRKVHLFTPYFPVEYLTPLLRFREYGSSGFKSGPGKWLVCLPIVILPVSVSQFKDRWPKIRSRWLLTHHFEFTIR